MKRVVLVTGASRGIGRATALTLSRRGEPVVLLGRVSSNLSATVDACRANNSAVRAIACDMSDPAQIDAAVASLLSEGVAPRAIINNAGVVERARLEDLTLESFHRQINTNLLGPMWLTRALLPSMRAAGSGAIVNVGSISGTLGTAQQCVYNASKWALVGFTKSLAEELSGSGLFAVTVLPGAVDTDMLKDSLFKPRMSAEDVAEVLTHYALDAPPAHNGASIDLFGS